MTGEELRQWRESRGILQTEMAELLGLSYGTYRGQETGRFGVNPLMPLALCEVERRIKKAKPRKADKLPTGYEARKALEKLARKAKVEL